MRRTWTIIGVGDVRESSRWYPSLLGLPETAPAHGDFGQILDSDGTVLLCLHAWGAEEHPSLMSHDLGQPGNGPSCFSASTTSTRRCSGHAPSPLAWKKRPT
jgi:hypothetical protein